MYRVVNVQKNQFISKKDNEIFTIKTSKKIIHQNENIMVGDFIDLEFKNNEFVLKKIFNRKNYLYRPKVSNINFVCFFYSLLDDDKNIFTLNKYLFYLNFMNIEPILIFTKKDLVKNIDKKILKYEKLNINTFYISNIEKNDDFNKFENIFIENNLYVFTGISGVGKSTTINNLLGSNIQKIQDISKNILRGQNTTTSSTIFDFKNCLIVDTPGFSCFNLFNISKIDLAKNLNKFFKLDKCKYNDCLHDIFANQCTIKSNLDMNDFSFIYNDYLKLLKEIK